MKRTPTYIRTLISMLAALPLAVAGCGEGDTGDDSGKVVVVCTTTMIHDLATQIAGDKAVIHGIMKPGEDPHLYDVRPKDAQLIARADLVLSNGLHLEATLAHVIEHNAKGKVVALAEDNRITPLTGGQGAEAAPDPHCWFNVEYFKVYAQGARDALIEVDAKNADTYRANTDAYLKQLDELHAWVKEQIASVPKERRVMVTSHDAFEYYGKAYEIEVHAVIGISTEQQPRPQDVQALEELVTQRNVRALFIETSVNETLNDIVRKVAAKTNAKIGGELYSDSLGDPGTEAGTYIGMVRHNTATIVKALQ